MLIKLHWIMLMWDLIPMCLRKIYNNLLFQLLSLLYPRCQRCLKNHKHHNNPIQKYILLQLCHQIWIKMEVKNHAIKLVNGRMLLKLLPKWTLQQLLLLLHLNQTQKYILLQWHNHHQVWIKMVLRNHATKLINLQQHQLLHLNLILLYILLQILQIQQ